MRHIPSLTSFALLCLLTCGSLLSPVSTLAQSRIVRGIVKDQKTNETLPGATISAVVSKSTVGTDLNGQFSIKLNEGESLKISMIGYETQIVHPKGAATLVVQLKSANAELSEVVVVGYGTQKRANLTGAVATVNSESFKGRSNSSVGPMLQGQVPGLTVVANTGRPGHNGAKILVRGVGTLNDADPLFVIDGLPAGDINSLNPEDIENISVLKDAASASIYGVRGANGVIIITTKRSRKDSKPTINYSGYVGTQRPTALPEFLGSAEYMELSNEAKINAGGNPGYTDEQIEIARLGSDPDNFANTNWINEIYKKSAPQQRHNISLTGGGNGVNYYASYGLMDEKGLLVGNGFNSYKQNLRLNLTTKAFDRLDLNANVGYLDRKVTSSSFGLKGIGSAHNISPLVPVKFTNGNWGYLGGSTNPVAVLHEGGFDNWLSQEFTGNFQASLRIIEGLNVKGQYGLVKFNGIGEVFDKTITYTSPKDGKILWQDNNPNQLSNRSYRNLFQTFIGTIDYDKTFGKDHNVKALLGFSGEENVTNEFSASRTHFPTEELPSLTLGTQNQLNNSKGKQNALESVFGRLSYNYKNRYLAEGNFRRDGSSRFAPEKRWYTFFSGSAGWVFTEESFLKGNSIINFGKIRASYGTLGNDKVGDDFAYLAAISSVNTMPIGNQLTTAYRQTGIPNQLLTWESVIKSDIGADLSFLNSRLSFSFDYYINTTNDILLNVPLPDVLGTSYPPQNAGKVENKGWEGSLGWRDNVNDLRYSFNFNLSDVKNKVLSLGDAPATIGDRIRMVGQPIDAFYGFVAERISQASDYTYNEATKKYTPNFPYDKSYPMQPGDIIYKDLNGDGVITASDDKQVIGSSIPRYTYGFKGDLAYKGFDFSFFLQGVGKANGLLTGSTRHAFINDGSNPQAVHLDRWTPENTNASYPRLAYGYSYNQRLSSFWLEDAAYLRLKNIQLGYTLPDALTSKYRMSGIRAYISADNLFTSTKFYKSYDPESPVQSGSYYPQVKTILFGLNINFK